MKKQKITFKSLKYFEEKEKSKNDKNNKIRELIINLIINNKIPENYYTRSKKWLCLKTSIDLYIKELCNEYNISEIKSIRSEERGGRKNHYDFKLIINNKHSFNIEFKCNNIPQFVSPMKPSQYMDSSYEEYHYGYLEALCDIHGLQCPKIESYLKDIHSTRPKCLIQHQDKYYNGCNRSSKFTNDEDAIEFYKDANKLSNSSIKEFIKNNNINIAKLNEYLLETQNNKVYMIYKNGKFNYKPVNLDDYIIEKVEKDPDKNRYIGLAKSGVNIKILLRWKNGNGIAYPSFQIS
tara:strand:- start:1955 stop:2833 length:879 start_codon:yes stop_codon:yes gene_type:complete